ncbi:MAG TPA: mechanosensitive ion channel family protein [Acidobacteriota bacterium]|nr:mechanosensitive ion channel family protein [Acidobacteriota bacterium]
MPSLNDLLEWTFYSNSLIQWLVALLVFLISLTLLVFLKNQLASRLKAFSQRTENRLDDLIADVLGKTRILPLAAVAIWFSSQFLVLGTTLQNWIEAIAIVAVLLQMAIWGNTLIGSAVERYIRLEVDDEPTRVASTTAITFLARLILWSLILLVGLQNLGVELTPVITGMGIGGIALALAVQNILGDLFGSLSILLDKPFVVGDFIIVGDQLGTVERIGLKTTRVRSLHGEQLVFANSDLLNSRIRNFKRMFERRIVFSIGVVYGTPYAKLERIPLLIREIIEKEELVRFDRSHFREYGDFSLNFETVYWVKSPDFNVYMDIQQRINLGIYRVFEAEEIEFAFPTRTVHLEMKEEAAPVA